MPKIDRLNQKRPLCYDPRRKKFIFYRDITSGKEKIIPIGNLSPDDKKLLVMERQKTGPDYRMQTISGRSYTRDDVVEAIKKNDEIGKMTVEAEVSMLEDLLNEIQRNLERKTENGERKRENGVGSKENGEGRTETGVGRME